LLIWLVAEVGFDSQWRPPAAARGRPGCGPSPGGPAAAPVSGVPAARCSHPQGSGEAASRSRAGRWPGLAAALLL